MVKFMKQSDLVTEPNRTFSAGLSAAYKDVFDSSQSTVTIADLPYKTGLFFEIPTATTPNYGSGETVGYKLGLYVNSVTNVGNPSLGIWKSKQGITKREGNFGTNIHRDLYSMTSFCSEQPSTGWALAFESLQYPGFQVVTANGQRTITSGPYCTVDDAWDNWWSKSLSTLTKDGFKTKYGKTLATAFSAPSTAVLGNTLIIPLVKKQDLIGDTDWWTSNTDNIDRHGQWNPLKFTYDTGITYSSEYHWFIADASNTNLDFENSPSFGVYTGEEDWVKNSYVVTEPIGGAEVPNYITNLTSNVDLDFAIASSQIKTWVDDSVAGLGVPVWKSGFFYDESDSFTGGRALNMAHFCGSNLKWDDLNGNVRPLGSVAEQSPRLDGTIQCPPFGHQQCTMLKKSNLAPGIVMTKSPEETGTSANGTAASNKVRQSINVSLKINDIPEIVSTGAGAAEALFPSRGFAMWFKNRLSAGTGYLLDSEIWNLADDIYFNHYNSVKSDFEAATDDLTGINNSPFCGFVIYKFKSRLYCLSLGDEAGSAGWSWTLAEGDLDISTGGAGPGDSSARMNHRHIKWDPDLAACATPIQNDIVGKELVFHMVFNPRGSGFDLNIINKSTGQVLFSKSCHSTQASGSCNTTTSWNHFNFAGYNCATLGTGTGVNNNRPWFPQIDDSAVVSEYWMPDNIETNLDLVVDALWLSKAGFNYKHLNSTFSDAGVQAGLGISNRKVADSSVATSDDSGLTLIEDSTGFAPATYLSFGSKTRAEITPEVDGEVKYLYLSNFSPTDPLNVGIGIDKKYIKWCWSTDDVRLGQQLWGYNNAGSVVETGTLGVSMFTLGGGSGNERMYLSSAEITAEENYDITPLLSNEYFTQKGHIAYSTVDVSNAASMKSTIAKRENIFCSARVIRADPSDSYITYIDDASILTEGLNPSNEEYIAYVQGARNGPTNKVTGLKFISIQNGVYAFGVGNATKLGANKSIRYSDAYRTLVSTPLGTTAASVTTQAATDRIVWAHADNIKLSDGTKIDPRDYFNVGDTITVVVADSVKDIEGAHIIDEVGALYIGVSTNITGDETIATGKLSIKKSTKDFLIDFGTATADLRYDDAQRVFISPHRYWMFAEIFNYSYDEGPEKLPDKKYNSAIITDFNPGTGDNSEDFTSDHFGVTWGEFLITDSFPDNNTWDLTRTATSHGALVLDTDFGNGVFDAETLQGGYVKKHIPRLTISGSPLMNIIDITNIRNHKEYLPSESVYLWVNALSLGTSSKTNVSTVQNATAAQRPILLTVYEDERPDPPDLSVAPYESDAFLPEYKWKARGDDLWYGLLMIDNKNIASQYHNSLWVLHLNEDTTGYSKSDYTTIIKLVGSKPSDFTYPTYVQMTTDTVRTYASTKKFDFSGMSDSGVLSELFKAGDKFAVHHGTDNNTSMGGNAYFGVEFTVASVVDGVSGHIIVTETILDGSLHTSDDLTIQNHSRLPEDRYDGLAGNSKFFTSTDKTVLPFASTSKVKLMPVNTGDASKFSVSCHVKGADVSLSGTDYILYQKANNISGTYDYSWYLAVNAAGNAVVSVQGYNNVDSADTDVVTTLTSASIMPTDGETPMHICFTLDNELEAQNLKLFINGVQEASSGIAVASGSDNTISSWARDLYISFQEGPLFVGAENQSGENGFNGHIEEVVAYSDVIYPINPKDGKFLWTKPVEDFSGTGASIAPTSYTARLFIKDYHNIRGYSATEVATSGLISFRKPVFDLRGA